MHMHHHHHSRGGVRIAVAPGSIVGVVIMFFVALLMFGMAALFFAIGQSSRLLNTSFTITAAGLAVTGLILLVVAFKMRGSRANAQRLRATGIPGQAQIVGLAQTSMMVNYQPVVELQLQVATGTFPPYVVTRREIVPQIMLGRLTSGQPLPVMVDPANPQNLVILWESALNVPGGFGAPQAAYGAAPPNMGYGGPPPRNW
jgi:hypothetical protein